MADGSDLRMEVEGSSSAADDKTWILLQDSNGETRLMTQDELDGNQQNISQFVGTNYPVDITLPVHRQIGSNDGVVQSHTDINNNIQTICTAASTCYSQDVSSLTSTCFTQNQNSVVYSDEKAKESAPRTKFITEEDDIEALRSQSREISMDKQSSLSRANAQIELVVDDDLDSSLTSDGSLLEHISRQIAIQQPYLNPDSSGQPMTYHIEEIPLEVLEANTSLSESLTFVPNIMNHTSQSWYQPSQQAVDLRVSSQNTSYEPVTVFTPTNHGQQNMQYISARNTSTPVTMHSILQPIGTNESGRYVYTPHPKTGQYVFVSENSSTRYLSKPINTSSCQSKATDTTNKKSKPVKFMTPERNAVKTPPSSNVKENDNTSPDSSKSPGELDLDFPMFISTGEESREQHNLKERKRRARIKDACEVMRKLVPGMSDKTDKATVFEFAARYIHFLKGFTGNKHDKDFLIKYSPY